jgi:uncharacterized integral membrane protein
MKTFLKWLVLAPIGAVLIAFAVTNREPVRVIFDPLPGAYSIFEITAPLFIVLFLAAGTGVIAGSFATWLSQRRNRQIVRQARADLERLRREAEALRAQLSSRTAIEGPRETA